MATLGIVFEKRCALEYCPHTCPLLFTTTWVLESLLSSGEEFWKGIKISNAKKFRNELKYIEIILLQQCNSIKFSNELKFIKNNFNVGIIVLHFFLYFKCNKKIVNT